MTRQERTALGVVALLLALGGGARWLRSEPPQAAWSAAEAGAEHGEASRLLGRSREAAERAERARRPLAPGERIDPNTAAPEELQRLPRVGPGLAAKIVSRRETHGPFRTLADLDSVPGVGPALLAAAAPHVALPPAAPAAARPAGATLDLNSATAGELESLPGVGPALAARIVASRREEGRFRSPAELRRVRGIGAKSLERILPLVHASP